MSYPLSFSFSFVMSSSRRMMMTSGGGVHYKSMFDAGSQVSNSPLMRVLFVNYPFRRLLPRKVPGHCSRVLLPTSCVVLPVLVCSHCTTNCKSSCSARFTVVVSLGQIMRTLVLITSSRIWLNTSIKLLAVSQLLYELIEAKVTPCQVTLIVAVYFCHMHRRRLLPLHSFLLVNVFFLSSILFHFFIAGFCVLQIWVEYADFTPDSTIQLEYMSTNDKSTINFMSGYPLNRLSWLRPSSKFCNTVALHPRAQWLLFRSGDPLIEVSTGKPHQLSTNKLENILGKPPYFGQGQLEGESSSLDLESSRFHGPPSCFLGVLEHDNGEELSDGVKGDPYFALDVSKVEKNTLDEIHGDSEYSYTPARAATSKFSPEAGAIFAVARSMLDWNSRNKVRT